MGETDSNSENGRKFPANADIQMAAREDSKRHYFEHPDGGMVSIPCTDQELAQEMAADEYPDLEPEDFEPTTEDAFKEAFLNA